VGSAPKFASNPLEYPEFPMPPIDPSEPPKQPGDDDIPVPGDHDDIPVPGDHEVPEPTTIVLLSLGATVLLRQRK
jgi:hypothetical protein